MRNSLRAVIWDMGGVLLRTEDQNPRIQLTQHYGITRSDLNYLVFGNPVAQLCEAGRVPAGDRWQFVGRKLKLTATQLEEFQTQFWAGDRLDEDLVQFIDSLRPKFKTGLLSNAGPDASLSLSARYPTLLRPFDAIVFSGEIGLVKPDPAIYHYILNKLDVAPQEAIFIDDFAQNVLAARMVGMQTIQFITAQQVKYDLARWLEE